MKHIFTFTVCALALLLALTGCNIAPTPAETTEEIKQEELTSEEVTTDAVTTEKKEVNTDLGNVPSGDITVIQGKNKDEFWQEYENSEVSTNSLYPIKNDVIMESLTFGEAQFDLYRITYKERPLVEDLYPGFEFEMLLYTLSETDGASRLEWLLMVNIYYRHNGASDHMDVLSKDAYTLFDERNGIYLDQRIETSHTYRCHLNDQMFVLVSIPPDCENYEDVRDILLDYVLEIKEIANREVTESKP